MEPTDIGTSEATPAAAPAGMTPPKIAPELERLRTWAGSWTTKERYQPSDWIPNGGEGKGWSTIRLGPGGLLLEDYDSTGVLPLGPYQGLSVLTWDAKEHLYVSFWFDSIDPKGVIARGNWRGSELVLTGTGEGADGKKTTWRMIYSDVTPNRRMFTMDRSVEGGPMKRDMSMEYSKTDTD